MRFLFLALLNSLDLRDEQDYKEKYDALLQEFENYKQQVLCKYNAPNVFYGTRQSQSLSLTHEKDNDKTQLHLLKIHNSNLEERIRTINNEILNKETDWQMQSDHQQKVIICYIY